MQKDEFYFVKAKLYRKIYDKFGISTSENNIINERITTNK
jgi:hypothetical protein